MIDEAVAAYRALLEATPRDEDPAGWASLQNEIGYNLTIAGKRENNVARFEEAVPILRDAVAVQRDLKAVPAVAYTEDSLCDVLIELGKLRKDAALVDEAIAACKSALVVFQDNDLTELAAGSKTNLAKAEAVLAELR